MIFGLAKRQIFVQLKMLLTTHEANEDIFV